jgi:hypothetical protein
VQWRRRESNPRPQSRDEAASTSVAGALFSSPARLAGGVVGDQLPEGVPGSAGAGLAGLACYLIPGIPAAGERGPRPHAWFLIRPRGRTRVSPHLWFSREFYEATRDLGSPPPPRTDRVEACRPRGCPYPSSVARTGPRSKGTGPPRIEASNEFANGGSWIVRAPRKSPRDPNKATRPSHLEEPPPSDPRALRLGWRGLTPRWPRSLAARYRV